jgi:phosphatidate cytidylyltransferase
MFKTRIITSAIGIPILLGAAYLGGLYWSALIVLLASIALGEYLAMMRRKGGRPMVLAAYAVAGIILFRLQLGQYMAGWFLAALMMMILTLLFRYPRSNYEDLALSFLGAVYCGFFFSYALALSDLGKAFPYLLIVFVLTWASDCGGYLFGRVWGKHKLVPQLSPAKTWEGAWGAVVLTILTALALKYLTQMIEVGWIYTIGLGLLASVAGQVGDLLESSIKRYFGVKDSGNIIPGHGGVLDRFDSFMLVLPIVYYYLVVLV